MKVTIRTDPALGRVRGNTDQLEQAVMNLVLHALSNMAGEGELTLETSQVDLPFGSDTRGYVILAAIYSGQELDLDHLFEPVAAQEHSLALPVAHAIVRDHGGYLTAQAMHGGLTRLELLLPRVSEQSLLGSALGSAGAATACSVLLVESREGIRAQLHNFFESSGYNLLEAADVSEAVTLGQMYGGSLDLLIAEEAGAAEIAAQLRTVHPGFAVLRMVDRAEQSLEEIRRPFSQRALLEKAARLLSLRNDRAQPATTSR